MPSSAACAAWSSASTRPTPTTTSGRGARRCTPPPAGSTPARPTRSPCWPTARWSRPGSSRSASSTTCTTAPTARRTRRPTRCRSRRRLAPTPGQRRFCDPDVAAYLARVDALAAERPAGRVGLAPHSVRAVSRAWLVEIGRYAESTGMVVHVHACEQRREIEECLAEHGRRPIELLADAGCLGRRTTIVHGTHASDAELDLLADAGASVCLCPTTEANLG